MLHVHLEQEHSENRCCLIVFHEFSASTPTGVERNKKRNPLQQFADFLGEWKVRLFIARNVCRMSCRLLAFLPLKLYFCSWVKRTDMFSVSRCLLELLILRCNRMFFLCILLFVFCWFGTCAVSSLVSCCATFSNKPSILDRRMLLLLGLVCVGFAFIRSSPDKGFVDEGGRQLVFHGVNAVVKSPPWFPSFNGSWSSNSSLNERDFEMLSGWGFNFIRLGVMWPGVMPTNASVIDRSYLESISQIVSLAAKYGVVVLVDLHQDLLSPFFCGEGAPDYLVPVPQLVAKVNVL
jgi:hypothetical protein